MEAEIDREDFLDLFCHLVEDPLDAATAKPILLIEGQGGIGKSTLLKIYRAKCRELGIKHCSIDFKTSGLDVFSILTRFIDTLGPDKFPGTDNSLKSIRPSQKNTTIETSRNLNIGGTSNISSVVNSAPVNAEEQRRQWQTATSEFFREFRALKRERTVIMFDTYEAAINKGEIANWLESMFLPMAIPTKTAGLVVVIMGRAIPKVDDPEWGDFCQSLLLEGIPKKYWQSQYGDRLNLNLQEVHYDIIWQLYSGHPGETTKALNLLNKNQGE